MCTPPPPGHATFPQPLASATRVISLACESLRNVTGESPKLPFLASEHTARDLWFPITSHPRTLNQ